MKSDVRCSAVCEAAASVRLSLSRSPVFGSSVIGCGAFFRRPVSSLSMKSPGDLSSVCISSSRPSPESQVFSPAFSTRFRMSSGMVSAFIFRACASATSTPADCMAVEIPCCVYLPGTSSFGGCAPAGVVAGFPSASILFSPAFSRSIALL